MADPRAAGDMERRLANVVRVGVVESVDYASARVRVSIGGLRTAPLPWVTGAASGTKAWSAPAVGEQVLVLAPSGELAQGAVLRGMYSSANPSPGDRGDLVTYEFPDGSLVTWDDGTITVKGVSKVVVDAPDIRLGSAGANDPVVRRSDLQAAIDAIKDQFDNHGHVTPTGPSGPALLNILPATPALAFPIIGQGSGVTSSD